MPRVHLNPGCAQGRAMRAMRAIQRLDPGDRAWLDKKLQNTNNYEVTDPILADDSGVRNPRHFHQKWGPTWFLIRFRRRGDIAGTRRYINKYVDAEAHRWYRSPEHARRSAAPGRL